MIAMWVPRVPRLVSQPGLRTLTTSTARPAGEKEVDVNIPMIRKMERICRCDNVWHSLTLSYSIFCIAGITSTSWSSRGESSTTSRTSWWCTSSAPPPTLSTGRSCLTTGPPWASHCVWPGRRFKDYLQYLEDFNECKAIMGYKYPETLVEEFLTHKVDKQAKILDMACGPGNVAYIVRGRQRVWASVLTYLAPLYSWRTTTTPTLTAWTPARDCWTPPWRRGSTGRPSAATSRRTRRLLYWCSSRDWSDSVLLDRWRHLRRAAVQCRHVPGLHRAPGLHGAHQSRQEGRSHRLEYRWWIRGWCQM